MNRRLPVYTGTEDYDNSGRITNFFCCFRLTWTLWKVDQKHLESFEMCCWRRMETISWTDRVRNEEVLLRVKELKNILHEISKR